MNKAAAAAAFLGLFAYATPAALRRRPVLLAGSVPWFVYLLTCRDGSLYCGITVDMEKRLAAHAAGTASKYTRSRLPVVLAAVSAPMPERAARQLELQLKALPKAAKLPYLRPFCAGVSYVATDPP